MHLEAKLSMEDGNCPKIKPRGWMLKQWSGYSKMLHKKATILKHQACSWWTWKLYNAIQKAGVGEVFSYDYYELQHAMNEETTNHNGRAWPFTHKLLHVSREYLSKNTHLISLFLVNDQIEISWESLHWFLNEFYKRPQRDLGLPESSYYQAVSPKHPTGSNLFTLTF